VGLGGLDDDDQDYEDDLTEGGLESDGEDSWRVMQWLALIAGGAAVIGYFIKEMVT